MIIFDAFRKAGDCNFKNETKQGRSKKVFHRHFKHWRIRREVFDRGGFVYERVSMSAEPCVYVEGVGAELEWLCKVICAASVCCRGPETISVARLFAHGRTRTWQN